MLISFLSFVPHLTTAAFFCIFPTMGLVNCLIYDTFFFHSSRLDLLSRCQVLNSYLSCFICNVMSIEHNMEMEIFATFIGAEICFFFEHKGGMENYSL